MLNIYPLYLHKISIATGQHFPAIWLADHTVIITNFFIYALLPIIMEEMHTLLLPLLLLLYYTDQNI